MEIKNKLIQIGRFTSTYAIKGELKLFILNDINLNDNLSLKSIFVENKNSFDVYNVEKHYIKANKDIIKLKEFNNINEVINISKCNVYVLIDENIVEKVKTVIGYNIEQNQKIIGEVIDFMNNGVYELFLATIGQKQVWIPDVSEYVLEVNDDKKIIYCQNIERLE